MKKIIFAFTGLLIILSTSNSLAAQIDLHLVLGAGLFTGGDKLSEYPIVVYTEGLSYGSTNSFRAGEGAALLAGGAMNIQHIPLKFQFTFSWYSARKPDVEGLKSKYSRYSIDVFPYYDYKIIRLGAGLSYYFNQKFTDEVDSDELKWKDEFRFDNSLGYFFEGGYIYKKIISINLRYTIYSLHPYKINANNIGIFFIFTI